MTIGFNDDTPPENYLFKFEKWKEFWPEHLTRPDEDFTFLRLPVSIFIKPWYFALTSAERGILLDLVQHTYSMRTAYVQDMDSIGTASGRHTDRIRTASILKFEQLGIVSELTHRQGRKEERKERKKESSVPKVLDKDLHNINEPSPLIDQYEPTLTKKEKGNDAAAKKGPPKHVEMAERVVANFNKVCGREFEPTAPVQKFIKAWMAKGYGFEDFEAVIKEKWSEWKDTPMERRINPKMLLRYENFEDYLNQAKQSTSYAGEAERERQRKLRDAIELREAEIAWFTKMGRADEIKNLPPIEGYTDNAGDDAVRAAMLEDFDDEFEGSKEQGRGHGRGMEQAVRGEHQGSGHKLGCGDTQE